MQKTMLKDAPYCRHWFENFQSYYQTIQKKKLNGKKQKMKAKLFEHLHINRILLNTKIRKKNSMIFMTFFGSGKFEKIARKYLDFDFTFLR